jgi:Leucine-rich repeat (LRR) protein
MEGQVERPSYNIGYSFNIEDTKVFKSLKKVLNQSREVSSLKLQYSSISAYNREYEVLNSTLIQLKDLKSFEIEIIHLPGESAKFPDGVFSCVELEHLVITGIDTLSDDIISSFENLSKLRVLSIAHSQLNQVPTAFCQLKEIRVLELYLCRIDTIPEEIFELKNLTSLNLGNNCFRTFPTSLKQLPELKFLYLYNRESPQIKSENIADIAGTFCYNKFSSISLNGFESLNEIILRTACSDELKDALSRKYPGIEIK